MFPELFPNKTNIVLAARRWIKIMFPDIVEYFGILRIECLSTGWTKLPFTLALGTNLEFGALNDDKMGLVSIEKTSSNLAASTNELFFC